MALPEAMAFRNPSLPVEQRAADLVARLSTDEKIALMNHRSAAVERLGIPEYDWWSEALHGVARAGRATVFPQAINLAATFDDELVHRVASAIGDEGRAKHHAAARAGNRGAYRGLTFWTPNVNIFRDPRWGRGQETWGEDPTLTAWLASAFVRGLQGDDPDHMKAAACAKHYAVHSGPEAIRHEFDAHVSVHDLEDTYLPAFQALVEAGVEAVMGAYNRTLGEPCCGSDLLIRKILRERWGFQGHFVSDCWAIQDFHLHHKITADEAESAALAVRMGCDLSCGCAYHALGEALERGLLSEADIDACVTRLMKTRIKLGMFDPEGHDPYASIPESVIACAEHRELAREAAAASVVLLKNDGVLPLAAPHRVLLCGPTALDQNVLLGNYFGLSDRMVSLAEGIIGALPEGTTVEYRMGCPLDHTAPNKIDWLSHEARNVDLVIACIGLTPNMEGEEGDAILSPAAGDRVRIELPEAQLDMVRKLAASGTPLVLLVTGGAAIAMPEAHDLANGVVWVGYPGEQGGKAVADVLFGRRNPSGKLPISWPKATDDLPPFEDYAMEGRTYRYATQAPLYPFGFGLGYARFRYRALAGSLSAVEVELTNEGGRAGVEAVQLYVSTPDLPYAPRQALKAVRRVELQPGETRSVRFELTPHMLSVVDESGARVPATGRVVVSVGGCSPGDRGLELGAAQPAVWEFVAG